MSLSGTEAAMTLFCTLPEYENSATAQTAPAQTKGNPNFRRLLFILDPLPSAPVLGDAAQQVPWSWNGTAKARHAPYWPRANPEQCLLATRGKPGRLAKSVRRLVIAPKRPLQRGRSEGIPSRLGGEFQVAKAHAKTRADAGADRYHDHVVGDRR